MIVDRIFRDVVQVFTDLDYEVKMPYYLEKGNKQHTTLEANESRLVTKVRWTVESFHARFKNWRFFSDRIENQMLPKLEYCIRIISACLNCCRGAIVQNHNSLEIQAVFVAAAMKDRKGKCNTLLALIETGKISARQRWSEIDEANIDFPLMDLDDLKLLFFGSCQIKPSITYAEERLSNVCPELKKMINNLQLPLPSSTNTQQSLTTSDKVPQQVASPNLIPIISPSDTIQSNLTLSTASSISISTDNNESIMQQSSSLKIKRQVKRRVQTIESSYNTKESAKKPEEDNFYMLNIFLFVLLRLLL
ncbi:unnamed protein product [Didymodactylos carnosus]|uniref:DDE Tnp4 domain-containing protein n=1 Tax=Didymodactylos carnosus TaxID=1234261 RepID=A0A814G459_9BILA|nr:unnamed protein product [Didymodactylos carnosus]CAF0993321.1 unnamed protein product [Didymodactylos carnosus]CAF3691233.1 unnamed protein product [Didymodactylos carnosus]CAF3765126.1 unnamed protein product [Didymodactylos carnosus]